MSANAADEKEALDMLGKLSGVESDGTSVIDVFGWEVDVDTVRARLNDSSPT